MKTESFRALILSKYKFAIYDRHRAVKALNLSIYIDKIG